jgi:hypothetical protein
VDALPRGQPRDAGEHDRVQFSGNGSTQGVSKSGGVVYATANDFAQLKSRQRSLPLDDREPLRLAHPASAAFTVKKKARWVSGRMRPERELLLGSIICQLPASARRTQQRRTRIMN